METSKEIIFPQLDNINHEDFPYLYLKIKSDAKDNFIANELFTAINNFIKSQNSKNYQQHEITIKALIDIVENIYKNEDNPGKNRYDVKYSEAVKILALKYLQITHKFDDIPELKI